MYVQNLDYQNVSKQKQFCLFIKFYFFVTGDFHSSYLREMFLPRPFTVKIDGLCLYFLSRESSWNTRIKFTRTSTSLHIVQKNFESCKGILNAKLCVCLNVGFFMIQRGNGQHKQKTTVRWCHILSFLSNHNHFLSFHNTKK